MPEPSGSACGKPGRGNEKIGIEYTGNPHYHALMYTVAETPTFQKQADKIWTEDERLGFIQWLAANPDAGDVIPGADGARKVRWTVKGSGKRGGVRVIYFNQTAEGVIYLIAVYKKNETGNMPSHEIRKRLDNGY